MLLKNIEHENEFNEKRTRLYISAMEEGFNVRKNELASFDIDNKLKNIPQSIVDLGAGNGYLTMYLAKKFPTSTIYAIDASIAMREGLKKVKNIALLEKLNLKDNSIDAIFSLATFHHITDKKHLLKELCRILKPGGFLFIGDVNDNTPTQAFFDTVVKKYCITKHDFDFLDSSWISYLVKESGLILKESKIKNTSWIFDNEKNMLNFIKKLTGLEISNPNLKQFLYKNFKIIRKNKHLSLPWQLGYHILQKKK